MFISLFFMFSPKNLALLESVTAACHYFVKAARTLSVALYSTLAARWLLSRFTPSPFARSRWGGWYHRLDWTDYCFLWGCGANTNSSKVKAIHNVVKDTVAVIKVIAKGVHVKTTIHSLFSLN